MVKFKKGRTKIIERNNRRERAELKSSKVLVLLGGSWKNLRI